MGSGVFTGAQEPVTEACIISWCLSGRSLPNQTVMNGTNPMIGRFYVSIMKFVNCELSAL